MTVAETIINRLIEFGLLKEDEIADCKQSFLDTEQKIHPPTPYMQFIGKFNEITGKKYKPDIESREMYYKEEGYYSLSDRIKAINNCLLDPWIKEAPSALTPKFILKHTGKYVLYVPPKDKEKEIKISNSDYNEVKIAI